MIQVLFDGNVKDYKSGVIVQRRFLRGYFAAETCLRRRILSIAKEI